MGADDLLRDTFAAYADRAPSGLPLARAARARAGARRRARLAVGATAVATAVVAVGAVAVVPRGGTPAPPVASAPPTPTPVPTPATRLPGPVRYESWHGLQVAVPRDLPVNAYRCTAPEKDTILVPGDFGVALCGAQEPPGLTVAQIGPPERLERGQYELRDLTYEPTTLDGRPARRVTARTADGRHLVGVLVPEANVGYWVVSPDRDRAEALAAEAHLVDVDHSGCPTKPARLYPEAPERPDAATRMVPGTPVELTACRYDVTGLLMRSKRVVAGPALAELARQLNDLPPGYGKPAPRVSSDCRKHVIEPVVLTFRYADGPPLEVIVHVNGCERVGVSNGAARGRFTPAFLNYFLGARLVPLPTFWSGWLKD